MNIFKKSQDLCHLLQNDRVKMETLQSSLERIKDLVDQSHLHYSIERCKICGQLFLFEFLEFVDWVNGNDPQYCTWVPIKTIEEGEKITKEYGNPEYGIMQYNPTMELRHDYTAEMDISPEYAILLTKNNQQ